MDSIVGTPSVSASSDEHLQLAGLRVRRDAFQLQLDATITLNAVTAIFGASGSGKSTLLRSIAGLLPADAGRIQFRQSVWFDQAQAINTPAHTRPIGTLFQDSRLFSHRTVAVSYTHLTLPTIYSV